MPSFKRSIEATPFTVVWTGQSKNVCCSQVSRSHHEHLQTDWGSSDVVTDLRSPAHTLLLVAFCRTMIKLSNASFNHQSMSFKEQQLRIDLKVGYNSVFRDDVYFVLEGASQNPAGWATVLLGDARQVDRYVQPPFDLVVTSPPSVRRSAGPSGNVLANYLVKYFDEIWMHLRSLTPLLSPGAEVHYIAGNSKFYNTVVVTERLYAEMLGRLGFVQVRRIPIRKRSSKKELVEYDVTGVWKG